ncbi:M24 family metallopeptidase [Actinomarinicola tropica]|uniref:M24 family metallopeptidase n=2 Tax=Actinomarinicola tropica TaxID=2789776 RepID=A0A5Q2RS89_9ACTN|nr:M24 family metallopeptidase [Actinomarinicola tropica]
MDRLRRVEVLRGALDGVADAMLLTKLVNVRWLTGFTGSAGMLLVGPRRLLLVTDGRYREQAEEQLGDVGVDAEIEITSSPAELLRSASSGWGTVALEADDVTWSMERQAATEWFPAAELVPTSGLVEELRAVKDGAELDRIAAAAAIADDALAGVASQLGNRPSEAEVATELEAAMRRAGAEGPAFETIVAAGPHSAQPHHHPGSRRIERGDLVVIDMGAMVDGYRSDMTRTFCIGEPSAEQRRLLDVVEAAHDAGVAAARPGARTADVDAAARSVVRAAGWAEHFVHPTGHGLGLEIHEPLRLSATSDATLAAGHAVTVEPGVYLPGLGGARLEDTLEITPGGNRALTRSSTVPIVG